MMFLDQSIDLISPDMEMMGGRKNKIFKEERMCIFVFSAGKKKLLLNSEGFANISFNELLTGDYCCFNENASYKGKTTI